jgi:beta-glucanase (GH16 family)
MLPEDDEDDPDTSGYGLYGPWPYSGEIDIFESANNMRRQWSTIHFADSAGNDVGLGRSTAFNTREHTIEYIWRVGSMVWLIDGKVQQTIEGWQATVTQEGATTPHSPFDQRFHLLINLALGRGLTGQSDPSAVEDMFRRKPGSMSTFRVGNLRVYGLPAE